MGVFKFIPTSIDGLTIIEPTVYGDNRGFFMESYALRDYVAGGIELPFVQDNHSFSKRGVLRGIHFQKQRPQGKLIRVMGGSVLDVAVDLRPESPTFGRWESVVLSGENNRQLYVPPRFGHGFLVLQDDTHFLYKCTEYYDPTLDIGLVWNDPAVGIDWNLKKFGLDESDLILSPKDIVLPPLSQIDRGDLI